MKEEVITASLSVIAAECCPGELYFTPGRTVKFVISILRLQTFQSTMKPIGKTKIFHEAEILEFVQLVL